MNHICYLFFHILFEYLNHEPERLSLAEDHQVDFFDHVMSKFRVKWSS